MLFLFQKNIANIWDYHFRKKKKKNWKLEFIWIFKRSWKAWGTVIKFLMVRWSNIQKNHLKVKERKKLEEKALKSIFDFILVPFSFSFLIWTLGFRSNLLILLMSFTWISTYLFFLFLFLNSFCFRVLSCVSYK